MKFGLSLPTLTGYPRASEPDGATRRRYELSYEICELAEDLGFDLVTIGQHRFTPENIDSPAPMVTLAALAARTNRLRLCTNIMLLATHNAIEVAEQAAVVDEISGGRLTLGVGIGHRSYEFAGAGLDIRDRLPRLQEALDLLRLAWTGEPIDFEGRFYGLRAATFAPRPVQRPSIPIWYGALADGAILRAARIADGWLTENVESVYSLAAKADRYRKEAAENSRPAVVALNRRGGIGPTREYIDGIYLPPILERIRIYVKNGVTFGDMDFMAKLAANEHIGLEDMPKGQLIAGTPVDCIEAVRLCKEQVDPDWLICDFGRGAYGGEYERLRTAIELFGREVMPEFR